MVYKILKMKRTNIYLTGPQVKALDALSAKTGMSASEIIRRALDEYLKKEK